jgi:hypothetical protein
MFSISRNEKITLVFCYVTPNTREVLFISFGPRIVFSLGPKASKFLLALFLKLMANFSFL